MNNKTKEKIEELYKVWEHAIQMKGIINRAKHNKKIVESKNE